MKAIFQATSGSVPTSIAVATYASDRDVHFLLCSFVDMTDDVADIETLPEKLAELHMKDISPNGKYGSPVPTCQGALQQPYTWTDLSERFFTGMIQRCFNWEQDMDGLHSKLSLRR
jgi:protein-ribulosamine 3-kinase